MTDQRLTTGREPEPPSTPLLLPARCAPSSKGWVGSVVSGTRQTALKCLIILVNGTWNRNPRFRVCFGFSLNPTV